MSDEREGTGQAIAPAHGRQNQLSEQSSTTTGSMPPARHYRKRVSRLPVITIVALAALIVLAAMLSGRFLDGSARIGLSGQASTTITGSFVQLPLNPTQQDALRLLPAHLQNKQLASLYVARMNIDEELGQLIMVEYADTSYSPDLDTIVHKLHAGGIIMYEFQMLTADQTKHDIAEMQKHADLPLLISTDEEGGYVHRLLNIYPPRPSAMQIYESGDPNYAASQGHLVARDLKALGINVNLAPDIDVALNPNGPDQMTRTFGQTLASVLMYASPYLKAMQQDGTIGTVKHYPGLGDANIDAHFGLPVINRTKEQIYAVELAAFKHFIQSPNPQERPGMIMPTDLLMPAIDPTMPAELSHIFMTDILRTQFGYDGVALTDALYMQGISDKWSMPEAAVLALNAGNDMLLGPTGADQMEAMINGLKAALQNGTLAKARVDEAATRIIALKMAYHLMPAVPPQS